MEQLTYLSMISSTILAFFSGAVFLWRTLSSPTFSNHSSSIQAHEWICGRPRAEKVERADEKIDEDCKEKVDEEEVIKESVDECTVEEGIKEVEEWEVKDTVKGADESSKDGSQEVIKESAVEGTAEEGTETVAKWAYEVGTVEVSIKDAEEDS